MIAGETHEQALITFLALASLEEQARKPLYESNEFSSFLLLLIAAQPEAERLAGMVGTCAALSNALEAGMACVDPRHLARQFPREAPSLQLTLKRLQISYADHAVCAAIQVFIARVNGAKDQTLGYIVAGFSSDVHPIAAAWRSAAAAGLALIRALDEAFGERNFKGLVEATSPLIAFLEETSTGDHSAVGPDGTVELPGLREGREHKRVPVGCAASVYYREHMFPAQLRDLSVGGLGLDGMPDLPVGAAVRVEAGAMTLKGRIEWMKDGRAGVKLEVPLKAEDPRLNFLARV